MKRLLLLLALIIGLTSAPAEGAGVNVFIGSSTIPGVSVNVPGSIDSTCATDVTTALDSFVDSQLDGMTIVFPVDGCYRVDGTLEWTKNNVTLDGNNSTIQATTVGAGTRAHIRFTGGSNWTCDDLDVLGVNASPGTHTSSLQHQHGFSFLGVDGAVLNGCETTLTYGDGYYVGKNPGNGADSSDIVITNGRSEDAGRNALAVVAGSNITLQGGYFDFAGLNLFNVEPNNGNTVNGVDINGVTVGPWPTRQWQLSVTGPPDAVNPKSATVSNITLRNSTFQGSPMTVRSDLVEATNQTVMRVSNLTVANNTSDTQYTGPVASIVAYHTDGVTATGNTQTFSGGQNFAYACDSTSVTVSGNTFTGATGQLATNSACGDEPIAGDVAHLWVDGSGSCARDAEGDALYNSATACATFDNALDAASAGGDMIRVKAGTYGAQSLSGDKTSLTSIVGEGDGDDVILDSSVGGAQNSAPGPIGGSWSTLVMDANFVSVENLTSITDDPGPYAAVGVFADDNRIVNVDMFGKACSDCTTTTTGADDTNGHFGPGLGIGKSGGSADGARFTVIGGHLGRPDVENLVYCDHSAVEPIWVQSGGDSALIDGLTVNIYRPVLNTLVPIPPNQPGNFCGEDNLPHLETIRLEDADNVTLESVTLRGTDAGSGHIFTSSDPDNFTVRNTIFHDRGLANAFIQFGAGFTGGDWTLANNTFLDNGSFGGACGVGCLQGTNVFRSNFGYPLGCTGTNTFNRYSGSGSCGTNTYFGATAFGVDANGRLQSGSPAIDQGGAGPCAVADDIDNETRPKGSACDAGADEF